MARSISRFTASTSHRPGAVLPQDMGEPGGGSSGESEAGGEETPDPRALGRMMRDVAAQSGEPVEPEMNEVIRRLEAGEDPEAIESRMGGDLAGPAPGGDDTLYDG
jgi:hypothetical protein